ncbi:KH domain-containing protein [Almyronema epifaneia]|uniref:KH domain-containing protein n=1 Tax=Almyronema epifaneia S1 TaxID=2991925 RepID=A0ABW6IDK3_9CYAN
MSSSKSAPNLNSAATAKGEPDFAEVVRFLVSPFLEASSDLSVDCEYRANRSRVWIRVAFDGEDRGRVFGRGGRNIQAIRTVIKAMAQLSGLQAHLEIYGEGNSRSEREGNGPPRSSAPPTRSRPSRPKK